MSSTHSNKEIEEDSKKHMDTISKNRVSTFLGQSRGKLIVAGIAVVGVGLAGYAIMATQASGFFAAADPDQGTLSANAHIVNDAGASGGTAVQFTAPATTPPPTTPPPTTPPPSGTQTNCKPNPSSCGYPDTTNTGVPAGTTLTVVSGDVTISTANTVYDAKDVRGCINVTAPGVTIKRTKVTCTSGYGIFTGNGALSGTALTVQDVEVICGPNNTGIGYANLTVTRAYVHGCENGFDLDYNATIRDSYVTDIKEVNGGHGDGMQFASPVSNILIDHNSVIVHDVTSAVNWTDNTVSMTVQNNLLAGGGYTLYCPRVAVPTGAFKVLNNRFGDFLYAHTDSCGGSGQVFTGNYEDSNLAAIAPE